MIGAFRKTKFLLLFNLFSAKVSTNRVVNRCFDELGESHNTT